MLLLLPSAGSFNNSMLSSFNDSTLSSCFDEPGDLSVLGEVSAANLKELDSNSTMILLAVLSRASFMSATFISLQTILMNSLVSLLVCTDAGGFLFSIVLFSETDSLFGN